jgi:hypothetical protein
MNLLVTRFGLSVKNIVRIICYLDIVAGVVLSVVLAGKALNV